MTNIPEPTETGLGWHNTLSKSLIAGGVFGMGFLIVEGIVKDLEAKQYHFFFANVVAILLILVSAILGGKGIQAMGRIIRAENGERDFWLRRTRKYFSYQFLVLMLGAIVGFGTIVVRSIDKG